MSSSASGDDSDVEVFAGITRRNADDPPPAGGGRPASSDKKRRSTAAAATSSNASHRASSGITQGGSGGSGGRQLEASGSGLSQRGTAARASRGASVAAGASKANGKGQAKTVETLELDTTDESADDRSPSPASALKQSQSHPGPAPATKPAPRQSMPAPSAFKPPRPAPRKSEPTRRTNTGFIELSDSSDDDLPRAAQPAAAHTSASLLSQKPSAGTEPQPAGAQTPGRRVPRASLDVQKETHTPSGPVSTAKSPTTGSTSAAPAAPAERKAQVAAKTHPSSGAPAAQSPAKLPRTTGSAAQPIHSASKQPAGPASTSNRPPSSSSSSSKQLRPPTSSNSRSNTATGRPPSLLLKKSLQAQPSPSTSRTEPRGPPSSAPQPAASASSKAPAAPSTSRAALPVAGGAAASSDSDSDSEIEILSVGGVACAPQRKTLKAQSTGPTRERERDATQLSVRAMAAREGTLADGSASGLRRQPSPASAAPVRDRSSSAREAVNVEECEPDERAKSSKSGVFGAASKGVKEGTSVAARAQSDDASPASSLRPSAPEGAAHAVQQEQQPSGFAGSSSPEGSTTPVPQAVYALVSTSAASMGDAAAPGAVRDETPGLRGFADSPASSDAGHDVRSATDAAGVGTRSALDADAAVAAAGSSATRNSSTPTSDEDEVMRESAVDMSDDADEVNGDRSNGADSGGDEDELADSEDAPSQGPAATRRTVALHTDEDSSEEDDDDDELQLRPAPVGASSRLRFTARKGTGGGPPTAAAGATSGRSSSAVTAPAGRPLPPSPATASSQGPRGVPARKSTGGRPPTAQPSLNLSAQPSSSSGASTPPATARVFARKSTGGRRPGRLQTARIGTGGRPPAVRAQREDTSSSEGETDGETREEDEREERVEDEDEEEGDDEQGPEKRGDMDGAGEDEDELGRASPTSDLALAFATSAPVLGELSSDSPPLSAAATAPPLLNTASAASAASQRAAPGPPRALGRKSTGGRTPTVIPQAGSRAASPAQGVPAAASSKRKASSHPSAPSSSEGPLQKKRRRHAEDVLTREADVGDDGYGDERRLRSRRSLDASNEVAAEDTLPLVLETDATMLDMAENPQERDELEAKIDIFKRNQQLARPWECQIAGPSYDLDDEFSTEYQDAVNRRERRWARRRPYEHPIREGYKQLFEQWVLEANAQEHSPSVPDRRPRVRVLPPEGLAPEAWSSPPFEFIYTNRVVYADGIVPSQAPGCGCAGNCGSPANKSKCSCLKRQVEASRSRPGGGKRSDRKDFAYGPDRRLDDKVFRSHDPIVECNSQCGCGPECINRVVGSRRSISVDIFFTGKKGWGVRVPPPPPLKPKPEVKDDPFSFYKTYEARTIKRGEPLAIYAGELLRSSDAQDRDVHVYSLLKRSYIYDLDSWTIGEEMRALAPPKVANRLVVSKQDSAHKSTTQPAATSGKGKKKKPVPTRLVEGEDDDDDESFTSLYSIDAFNMGNWTRFANHVCQGFNVVPRPVYVDEGDVSRPLWVYFALRDIHPGEEITISYSSEHDPAPRDFGYSVQEWKDAANKARAEAPRGHRCYCGKTLCRGTMFNAPPGEAFWEKGDGRRGG